MDELAAHLDVLIRRHALALERGDDDGGPIVDQFQKQLRLLAARYGVDAVEDALNRFCSGPELSSLSLH
jgi:hypothetical protein